jgi:galactonate dehydratase
MRITEAKTYVVGNPWKNWVFVRLETDEGIHGIGEGTLNGFAKTTEACIRELGPFYAGMDPFQIEVIVQKMTRDVYSEGGQIHRNAVAAIEVACWDIVGKALKQPIYNLLGGRCHEKVRAYANGWYQGPRTPDLFAEKAKEVVRRGYTALKFDPFGANHRMMTPAEEALSLDICTAVREAVGPHVDILIEGHCRFTPSTAIKFAQLLEPLRPTWFEEPIPHQEIAAMAEVARRSPVPIATGESLSSAQQFAELLSHNAVHILQPEVMNCGGLLNAKKICAMVDSFYGVVAPHNAQGPVSTAICLQLAACTPNFFLQEIFDEFNVAWESQIVDHPAHVVDGYLTFSERPGLGIDLNLEECAKYPYHQAHYIPLFHPGWERREGAASS